MTINVSLIVSTYNSPRKLYHCLQSVIRQTILPMEIIVADDGSTEETKILINQFAQLTNTSIVHVWHEDKGFRLAEIRNKAIDKAKGNYIIQIDGDLILEKHFIADHIKAAKYGYFAGGGRAKFDQSHSEKILKLKNYNPSFFSRGLRLRENALRLIPLAIIWRKKKKKPVGCNMAFWKEDLIRINGYDNDFVGWGHEDLDLSTRLNLAGVEFTRLKFCAITYHLYHKEEPRDNSDSHYCAIQKRIQNNGFVVKNGIIHL